MKILILGSSSREHCLLWKLLSSSDRPELEILAIPGNEAMAKEIECLDIDINDSDRILDIAVARNVFLTIVSDPNFLASGIVDKFRAANKLIFGANQSAARLEFDHLFTKNLLIKNDIPCGSFACFEDKNLILTYLSTQKFPLILKSASANNENSFNKLVNSFEEAALVIEDSFRLNFLQPNKTKIIVEELLHGDEFSINTICDGYQALSMPPVHRYGDFYSDAGAYAPSPIISDQLMFEIRHKIINPTLKALVEEDIYFTGFLSFDVIIDKNDKDKPVKLKSYRASLGLSDSQVVLPLLDEDLFELMLASAQQDLNSYSDGLHRFPASALTINIFSETDVLDQNMTDDFMKTISEESYKGSIPIVFYGKHKKDKSILAPTVMADTLVDAQLLSYKLAHKITNNSNCFQTNIGDQGLIQ